MFKSNEFQGFTGDTVGHMELHGYERRQPPYTYIGMLMPKQSNLRQRTRTRFWRMTKGSGTSIAGITSRRETPGTRNNPAPNGNRTACMEQRNLLQTQAAQGQIMGVELTTKVGTHASRTKQWRWIRSQQSCLEDSKSISKNERINTCGLGP